jgi:2-amino-4-hydroxy-6-hydroxymethyldihydropteridine diphosphokinase
LKNLTENKVYLGLGSNCGDRILYLAKAAQKINSHEKISLIKQSSIYETSPFGNIDQADYLNCNIEILTSLSIMDLFKFVKNTEQEIGRKKSVRWGPREIDIDILIYGDILEENEHLTVPHTGIKERDFVLVPLLELDHELKLPGEDIFLKEYLNRIEENYILNREKINLLSYSG